MSASALATTKLSRPTCRHEHGAIIVLFAVLLVPLLLMFALGIDVAIALISKAQQTSSAENAAIGALQAYADSGGVAISHRKEIATEVAERVAKQNLLVGHPGAVQVSEHALRDEVAGTIRFGTWDPTTQVFTEVPSDVDCNSVTVQLITQPSTSIVITFARSIGVANVNIFSEARAYRDGITGVLGKPSVYLVNGS